MCLADESAESCTPCGPNHQLYLGMCLTVVTPSDDPGHPVEHTIILCESRQYYSDRDGVSTCRSVPDSWYWLLLVTDMLLSQVSLSIQICHLCHPSCETCCGPGPANCLSCSPPCRYYEEGQCMLCCTPSITANCCQCHPRTGKSLQ